MGKKKHTKTPSASSDDERVTTINDGVMLQLEALRDSGPLPQLVAFDLDYTLWPLWVDTHVDPPIKRPGSALNRVLDRNGQPLSFFPLVPTILHFLKESGVEIAAASRTSAPRAARQALTGLYIDHKKQAIDFFQYQEIYPGSKITHFREIQKNSGVEFQQMVFYDDEYRNAEVGTKLGVHFVEVGHAGTDVGTFEKGIREWRAKIAARETQESSIDRN